MASHFIPTTSTRILSPWNSSGPKQRTGTSFSPSASLSSNSPSLCAAGLKIRPASCAKRSVVTMALRRGALRSRMPFNKFDHPPPDLESYYFQNRIILMCSPLYPAVIELMIQEIIYLAMEDLEEPVYMYINSTGMQKGDYKFGREREAFSLLDNMRCFGPPIFTLCIGHAWGEAALILTSGEKGHRTALPSSTIMIREPIDRFQGQASHVEAERREVKAMKEAMVEVFAECTGKTKEQIETDIRRPKYFSASEAVEYGLIDKVLHTVRSEKRRGEGEPVSSGWK